MKKLMILFAMAFAGIAVQAQTTWKVDPAHTRLSFTVSHMVITDVDGRFNVYEGSIVSTKDDFSDAQINFTVDAKSINTDNEKRDEHLRSGDFFEVEKFPNLTFKSILFKKVSGNKYLLEGDLTIRDVTQRVKFDVTFNGTSVSPWGQTKAGFAATTSIKRTDFGLKWNKALEAGGVLVGETVHLNLRLQFDKQ